MRDARFKRSGLPEPGRDRAADAARNAGGVLMDSADFDLIVVGAGLAGHCAALAGAQAGVRVALLEKMANYGGSTAMCGGAFAFAGTDEQRARGIDDSPERLEADLVSVGGGFSDRALVHTYADRQLEAYQWLRALGIRFDSVSLSGGQSVPRNHSTNPRAALELLHRHVLESGHVDFRAESAVVRLAAEGGAGARRVAGVVLADDSRLSARGGVVLSTGGFSRAADLIDRFVPALRAARPMGGEGNTGDGLRMAWALGADLLDMGQAKGTFGAPLDAPRKGHESSAPRIVSAMYRGAIVVNRAGRRFVDESVSYKLIGDRCLEQDGALAFQVFDQGVMDQSSPLPSVADYRAAFDAGLIRQAATLEGLAAALGIDEQGLLETVEAYNAACDGRIADAWGRRSLSTGFGRPTRVERAPFYGIACTTGLTSTYCGLRTDTSARVVDVFGRVIDGLYAIGELVGGFHGEAYMSGSSLGKGCVFGRIAAADAVARTRASQAAAE